MPTSLRPAVAVAARLAQVLRAHFPTASGRLPAGGVLDPGSIAMAAGLLLQLREFLPTFTAGDSALVSSKLRCAEKRLSDIMGLPREVSANAVFEINEYAAGASPSIPEELIQALEWCVTQAPAEQAESREADTAIVKGDSAGKKKLFREFESLMDEHDDDSKCYRILHERHSHLKRDSIKTYVNEGRHLVDKDK